MTLYRKIKRIWWNLERYYYYLIYEHSKEKIRKSIISKPHIKVVFFVINLGMWKSDYLFRLLLNNPRFDPYIISFLYPSDTDDYKKRNQEEMKAYFEYRGFPYINMYDYEHGKQFDILSFEPDIVFYAQPYGLGIRGLQKRCIFYYIPYCLNMEAKSDSYNTLLINICSKVFLPSSLHLSDWSKVCLSKGKNFIVTGYPIFDYLSDKSLYDDSMWKLKSPEIKRIIWAPHHSIRPNDTLDYSNFLLIADKMIDLAKKYSDKVQFVFKPHPRLRPKLEKMKEWGIEKTNHYYDTWKNMTNSSFVDGNYIGLFLSSDAMIHDCSTFMAEYLSTGKPLLFVSRPGSNIKLNNYGKACYDKHYHGTTLRDIDKFISEVVIMGNDYRREERIQFANLFFRPNNNRSVSKTIYSEILKDLQC